MSERPYMQLYIADYLGDTQHLSCEQHGAYLLLLMTMWRNGGELLSDEKKLARICRLTVGKWRRISDDVLEFFESEETENGTILKQKRLQKELQNAREISSKRAQSAANKPLKNKNQGSAKAPTNAPANDQQKPPKRAHVPTSISEEVTSVTSRGNKRGTRLPEDWQPTAEDRTYAAEKGLSEDDIAREAEKFRNYWHAKPGSGGVKLNWRKTWQNWCMTAAERKPSGTRQRDGPQSDWNSALDRLEEKLGVQQ